MLSFEVAKAWSLPFCMQYSTLLCEKVEIVDNLKAKMVLKYTNFKHYAKAHWLVSLVIVSILIMLAIHILNKIPAPISFLTAEWGAGDVLSFAGAIIGAIATIYVLQETISSTVSMQKEQRISSFRPYFVVEATTSHEIEGRVISLTNGTGNMTWIGNISGTLYLQNVGAGNAIVEQITFSCGKPKAADYQECVYKTIPALLVGEKNVFLLGLV